MMAPGMAHFHVAGTRASNLIHSGTWARLGRINVACRYILVTLIPLAVFDPTHCVGLAVGFPEMSIPV